MKIETYYKNKNQLSFRRKTRSIIFTLNLVTEKRLLMLNFVISGLVAIEQKHLMKNHIFTVFQH